MSLFRKKWVHPFRLTITLGVFLSAALSLAAPSPRFELIGAGKGFDSTCPVFVSSVHPLEKFGPRYLFRSNHGPEKTTALDDLKEITFTYYNVLNLIESPGSYVTTPEGKRTFQYGPLDKPRFQSRGIIRNIHRERPNFLATIETESLDAMMKLAALDTADKRYAQSLEDLYFKIFIAGNDDRIGLGLWVDKSLKIDLTVQSFRKLTHTYLGKEVPLLSRDFPVVEIRDAGAQASSKPRALWAVFHNKSQRSGDLAPGEVDPDPGSSLKREAQWKEQIAILKRHYRDIYGQDIPIIMGGDGNGDFRTYPEFKGTEEAGYRETLDLMNVPKDSPIRFTQSYFPNGGEPIYSQLDAIFLDEGSASRGAVIDARTVMDTDVNGNVRPLPKSWKERFEYSSDHALNSVVLDRKKFMGSRKLE